MYRGMSVAVVMPAFNERRAITSALDAVPRFVDCVVVVDDASRDGTAEEAARRLQVPGGSASRRGAGPCLEIVRHVANRGVGAALVTGYRRVLARGHDVAAVMAGDGQMDPADLPALLDPVAEGRADYVKGNRFGHPDVWRVMPPSRVFGNVVLSAATKLTSGYWHLFDSQCGYTAISRGALLAIDLGRLFPRYGYPNDLLARLHAARMRVVDVAVRPIYGPSWRSGIGAATVVYPIGFVLARSFAARLATEAGQRLARRFASSRLGTAQESPR